MRVLTSEVFDEIVVGTATTWYTSTEFDAVLGAPDSLGIHAIVTDVTGTSPTLTLTVQCSGNGQHWNDVGSPVISAAALSAGQFYANADGLFRTCMGYVRLAVNLGGTSPACRLKMHVCGRCW